MIQLFQLLQCHRRKINGLCVRAAALVAACSLAAPVCAEVVVDVGSDDVIRLQRHEVDVRIDGSLEEDIWAQLPYYGDFYVTDPDTLEPAPHATRVRIYYSDKGLYVGMDMDQPAETLIARLSGRDAWPVSRDGVGVTLDTSGSGRYGYWFNVHLGDSINDGTVLPERQFSSDWDGPWRGATHVTETGWSAEFFIPWGTVAMPKAEGVRRIGLYTSRSVAYRGDERWSWPPLPFTKPQFMSAMLPMELKDVDPKQQYNFYPYSSVTRDAIDGETRFKAGADLFWRPSSNFQLNSTLNPDFGAVESDDVVINLTATETFFPEKRLFFLEGQQIFVATPRADVRSRGISRRGSPYTMVNTRRIGGKPEEPDILEDLPERELVRPVDLLGAAKVTGQVGAFRYGVLAAFEDDVSFEATGPVGEALEYEQDGNDYGIVRLLWENNAGGRYRGLGFLSTAVVKGEGGDAYANGVDWHYFTRNARLKMDGQFFSSDIEGIGQGFGGFQDFEFAHRQGVSTRVGLEYMDDKIDLNDLGFLERNSEYQIRASHQRVSSSMSWARQNQLDIRGPLQWNLDNLLVRGGVFVSDSLTLNSLDRISAGFGYSLGSYDDLNSFGNGTFRLPAGIRTSLDYLSDTTKNWSVGVGGRVFEEDMGGWSYTMTGSIHWQPNNRFNMTVKLSYQDRDGWLLHQEDRNMTAFTAEQVTPGVETEYYISAKQQLRLSFQWVGITAREDRFYQVPESPGDLIEVDKPPGPPDDFTVSRLSFQARYRWELAPLSDLFIVYTRLADKSGRFVDESLDDIFTEAWEDPIANLFIVKLRYRLGS